MNTTTLKVIGKPPSNSNIRMFEERMRRIARSEDILISSGIVVKRLPDVT